MFGREPAVILGFIGAAIALAVGFGLRISGEQVNLIMVFAAAAIALATGGAIRSQVVPTEKANAQINTAIKMPKDSTLKQVIAKEASQEAAKES